jgi:hypothetical protein
MTVSDKLNKEIKNLLMHLWYLEMRIIYWETNWPIVIYWRLINNLFNYFIIENARQNSSKLNIKLKFLSKYCLTYSTLCLSKSRAEALNVYLI